MKNRLWLAALVLSLLLHLVALTSAGWRVPDFDHRDERPPLEAILLPRPAAPVVAVSAPPVPPAPVVKSPLRPAQKKPEAATRPVVSIPTSAPLEEASSVAPAAPGPLTAQAEAAASAPAQSPAQAELTWPHEVRIRYAVVRGTGDQATLVGESLYEWKQEGETYSLQTTTETTGLAALFHPVRVVQQSSGYMSPAGIVPVRFSVTRDGREQERAEFDWSVNKVQFFEGERLRREAELQPGAQDILSQVFQTALTGGSAPLSLMIVTGRKAYRYVYEPLGEETLMTRFGPLRTWRVKTPGQPGEQAMELWLARDYRNLPVRIRYTNRKGEIFDQNASELEVDDARLATDTPSTAQ